MALSELERKVGEIGEWLGPGTVNFFGRPYAGKDVQASRLAKAWGVPIISGGQILRASADRITPEVRAMMDNGELIPSEEYEKIVIPYLSDPAFEKKPLLLSSVGRMAGEEAGVIAATEAAGHPTKVVPYLDITVEEALMRNVLAPSRDRPDDKPEAQPTRHAAFTEQTEPVLATYDSLGLLLHIDAMQPEDLVFSSMVNLLHQRASTE